MNYTLNFVCRASKANRHGEAPVEMTICCNSKRVFLSLPLKSSPVTFKRDYDKRGSVVRKYCDTYTAKVQSAVLNLLEKGNPLTALGIKDALSGKTESVLTVKKYMDGILSQLRKRIDVDMTLQRYLKYKMVAEAFIAQVGENRALDSLTTVDGEDYIINIKKVYKTETAKGKLSILKTLLSHGLKEGKVCNIFDNVRPNFKKVETIRYLTEEEVAKIESKHFSIERLEKVRDLFLFQCNTGLSFTDMASLTKDDIKIGEGGQMYLSKPRKKTGIIYTVLLLPKAVEILEKYDYCLNVPSNQKMNAYLKEIADLCGISKTLTSHVGRHSAATMMLNHGLSIDIVAKVLGHSTTALTRHYAKLLDRTVLSEMSKLI